MKTRQKYNNGAGKAARMYLDWHRANPLVCSPVRLGLLALGCSNASRREFEEAFSAFFIQQWNLDNGGCWGVPFDFKFIIK